MPRNISLLKRILALFGLEWRDRQSGGRRGRRRLSVEALEPRQMMDAGGFELPDVYEGPRQLFALAEPAAEISTNLDAGAQKRGIAIERNGDPGLDRVPGKIVVGSTNDAMEADRTTTGSTVRNQQDCKVPRSSLYPPGVTTTQDMVRLPNCVIGKVAQDDIQGMTWHDIDGNGAFDPENGESPLTGWTIYVDYNRNGQPDDAEPVTVTDDNGEYSLDNVIAGKYAKAVAPPGWMQSAPGNAGAFTHEIHGMIWHDIDADGTFDPDNGESPLPGWTIYLDVDHDGKPSDGDRFTVTDNNGEYSFAHVPRDAHARAGIPMPGWVQTAPGNAGGFRFTDEVHGMIWHDLDTNGIFNPEIGESPLVGWTIYADVNQNGQLDDGEPVSVTNENGEYTLVDVPESTYARAVEPIAGWGQTAPGNPAGFLFTNDIHGWIWHDIDGDGTFNPEAGESPLAGWTIYVDVNYNGRLDVGEPWEVTDENGEYSFAHVPAGAYARVEVPMPGWRQTAPGNAGGFARDIHGRTWHDIDGDGVFDPEAGESLPGWTIYVDVNNNGQLDDDEPMTVTNANGEYSFVDVPAAAYARALPIPGWRQTAPGNAGGFRFTGKIHGMTWHDLDGDGTFDPEAGESPLPGWTIYVDVNNNGQPEDGEPMTVTDANGEYSFKDVPAAAYARADVPMPGWTQTTPGNAGGFRLLSRTRSPQPNPVCPVELPTDPIAQLLVGPPSYKPGPDFYPNRPNRGLAGAGTMVVTTLGSDIPISPADKVQFDLPPLLVQTVEPLETYQPLDESLVKILRSTFESATDGLAIRPTTKFLQLWS